MNRRQRQATAWALVALALIAGGLWWAMGRVPGPPAVPSPVPAAEVLARLALPESATGQRPPDLSRPGAERDSVELCGLGRFARKDIEEEGGVGDAALAALREDALRRTALRLQAQADERSRAVGHLLAWSSALWETTQAHTDRIAREGLDCTKQSCGMVSETATMRGVREALARLAVGTRDPWVYRLAHQVCSGWRQADQEAGACQLISVARWAQLEPDNAAPWLFAASEALTRQDAAGVAEALYRASKARHNNVRFAQSVPVAQAQTSGDVAPVLALGIDVALISIEAAVALPSYQAVTRHCAKDALADPNRRAVCDDLATMLVERSDTLMDLKIGAKMAEKLSWPADRLAKVEELRDAIEGMAGAVAEADVAAPSPMGCEVVGAQRERLREVAANGELAAYQRMIAASPLGRAGLAAQYRQAARAKPDSEAPK